MWRAVAIVLLLSLFGLMFASHAGDFAETAQVLQRGQLGWLLIAVVLQLVPFLYMFAALLKLAFRSAPSEGRYSRRVLLAAGSSGLITTTIAIVVAFFPASQITSVLKYELSMFGLTLFFLALAAFFFFVYGRKKVANLVHVRTAALGRPVEPSSTH